MKSMMFLALGVVLGAAMMALHYEGLRRALRAQRHEMHAQTLAQMNGIKEAVLGDRAYIRQQSYRWGQRDTARKSA